MCSRRVSLAFLVPGWWCPRGRLPCVNSRELCTAPTDIAFLALCLPHCLPPFLSNSQKCLQVLLFVLPAW